MKKMFLILGVALVSVLFTACEESISDTYQVKDMVQSLRETPELWKVGQIDEGKAMLFEKNDGKCTFMRSNLQKLGLKKHARSINLEQGGITLLPTGEEMKVKDVVGEALEALMLASEPLATAELARVEAEKKEASVIKVE